MKFTSKTKTGLALLAAAALIAVTATPAVAGSFSKTDSYVPQCNAYLDWSGGAAVMWGSGSTFASTSRESGGCAAALQASLNHGTFNTTYTTFVQRTQSGTTYTTSQHRYGGAGVSIGL